MDDTFDPFGLQEENAKSRPVLISVSEGASDPVPVESSSQSPLYRVESFDPFGIGALQSSSLHDPPNNSSSMIEVNHQRHLSLNGPPKLSRLTQSHDPPFTGKKSQSIALPPKLMVKLTVHEEVSSVAKRGKEREGASDVSIEGTIYAQVQCSDANKNAPFIIQASQITSKEFELRPNPKFAVVLGESGTGEQAIVIPKQEIGYVPVVHYTLIDQVDHMPILLERKVTTHEKSCRIAIQVRSKLSNRGDLHDFSIAVAIPESIDGDSIEIIRGDGHWDSLKRTIIWKLASLNKGESFMVSAQANFWDDNVSDDDVLLPVLLRCSSSADSISAIELRVTEATGHPTVSTFTKTRSFRLLHRLT